MPLPLKTAVLLFANATTPISIAAQPAVAPANSSKAPVTNSVGRVVTPQTGNRQCAARPRRNDDAKINDAYHRAGA
jgi:hypothetical protein